MKYLLLMILCICCSCNNKNSIVGTWVDHTGYQSEGSMGWEQKQIRHHYKNDGTSSIEVIPYIGSPEYEKRVTMYVGTYAVSGNVLTETLHSPGYEDSKKTQKFIYKIKDNHLILNYVNSKTPLMKSRRLNIIKDLPIFHRYKEAVDRSYLNKYNKSKRIIHHQSILINELSKDNEFLKNKIKALEQNITNPLKRPVDLPNVK